MLVLPFALIAGGCSSGGGVSAQAVVEKFGSLNVSVVAEGSQTALPGATVRLSDQAAQADGSGQASFPKVASGPALVSVTQPGYQSQSVVAQVPADGVSPLKIVLPANSAPRYDLVVLGAGAGGVSAAIQARRMGLKVALVEETDWIGGQMTAAAVTSLDEGPSPVTRSGLYKEFVDKVRLYYHQRGKSVGTAYFLPTSISYEPSVGQKVLYGMLAQGEQPGTGVDLYLCAKASAALKSGNRVTGVVLGDRQQLRAAIVLDATECGDFLPLAGARYRAGNSTSDALDLAANLNPLTYTAVIRKYPTPDPLLQLSGAPPGYAAMFGSLSAWVTLEGTAGTAWYDGGVIDYSKPFSFDFQNAWRGMPDSANAADYDAGKDHYRDITRTGVNGFMNDYPATVRYLEDRDYRSYVNCQAKIKTLQILYYFQHELGQSQWSVANDEGFQTPYNLGENACAGFTADQKHLEGHFPVLPYVRESRRVIGRMTMNAQDIRRNGIVALKDFPSALAVGDYPIDLHGARADADLDCGDRASDIVTSSWVDAGGTFQIPFEAFVPESVDGLLVAEKNLSVSRLVSGAIRLQPVSMMTGQAAGALAGVSVQRGVQPRAVEPLEVQLKLLEAGCVLSKFDPRDVPQEHPFWKDIQLAQLYQVIGSGADLRSFQPEGTVGVSDLAHVVRVNGLRLPLGDGWTTQPATRGDLARLLCDGLGGFGSGSRFPDVSGTPLSSAVGFLDSLGVIPAQMVADGYFHPGRPITRGEVAALVMRTLLAASPDRFVSPLLASDSTGPTGSIAFASSAPVTGSASQGLVLFASDDNDHVAGMQFSKDGGNTWYPWEPYATQRTVELPPGDGLKTISVRFRDGSFNLSPVCSASVTLDSTGPVGSIVINGGAASTASSAVVLTLSASDPQGVTGMQFSKDNSTWYGWEPFATTRSAILLPGGGLRYVYVRYRDSLGNVSAPIFSSITVGP